MKKLHPPFLSWQFNALLGNSGSRMFKMFNDAMKAEAIPLDSPISLLIMHILIKTVQPDEKSGPYEMIPIQARERLVSEDGESNSVLPALKQNFSNILDVAYGHGPGGGDVFVTIVQNVLVNMALELVSYRLLISYKLNTEGDRMNQDKIADFNRRLNFGVHKEITRQLEAKISEDLADG